MQGIKKLKKKNEQMVIVMVLCKFVLIDRETLEDMKYQNEECFSIIGFSDVDKVCFFFFIFIETY